jgi:hypothetical protein
VVSDWNATAVQTLYAAKAGPVLGLHALSMVHIAIYDAIRIIDEANANHSYSMLGSTLHAPTGASQESATAAAARVILLGLYPDQRSIIDAAYSASMAQIPDNGTRGVGVLIGNWAANKILAWRSQDGSGIQDPYYQPEAIGIFQPAVPGTAVFVHWAKVAPFVLSSGSQFRPPPPPAMTSSQYTADFNEVKSVGSLSSTTRTPDQTQAALFWLDDDLYMWNTVARNLAAQQHLTVGQEAQLFAELNVAMNDGLVAVFDAKYTYNLWRPVSAIHNAAVDGNPDTVADPAWQPLRATPAHPDYPAAHPTSGGAASRILASFFGTDAMSFAFSTRTAPDGAIRSYTSFSGAAMEEANSRVWVGFHFRIGTQVGLHLGQTVADWTVNHFGTVIPANP